jgi:hypothetical protein
MDDGCGDGRPRAANGAVEWSSAGGTLPDGNARDGSRVRTPGPGRIPSWIVGYRRGSVNRQCPARVDARDRTGRGDRPPSTRAACDGSPGPGPRLTVTDSCVDAPSWARRARAPASAAQSRFLGQPRPRAGLLRPHPIGPRPPDPGPRAASCRTGRRLPASAQGLVTHSRRPRFGQGRDPGARRRTGVGGHSRQPADRVTRVRCPTRCLAARLP